MPLVNAGMFVAPVTTVQPFGESKLELDSSWKIAGFSCPIGRHDTNKFVLERVALIVGGGGDWKILAINPS